MSRTKTDYCITCGEEEEIEAVKHEICNCPSLQDHRIKWLRNHILRGLRDISVIPLEDVQGFIEVLRWLNDRHYGYWEMHDLQRKRTFPLFYSLYSSFQLSALLSFSYNFPKHWMKGIRNGSIQRISMFRRNIYCITFHNLN